MSIDSVSRTGYSVLGFSVYGINAVIATVILNVIGMIVLLFALWKRYKWTWIYGIIYFAFFAMNGLLAIVNLPKNLELLVSPALLAQSPGMIHTMYMGALIGTLVAVALNVVFLIILYKKRAYFK